MLNIEKLVLEWRGLGTEVARSGKKVWEWETSGWAKAWRGGGRVRRL